MIEIPWIVSVDDHVIEPPHLWSTRLPARYREAGPRVVRLPTGLDPEVVFKLVRGNAIRLFGLHDLPESPVPA